MRHLDSDALLAFVAVAEAGSFTVAAQRINKSQAAVSIAVARLEERLGRKLFDRLPRRVALTSAGERLHHYAQKILSLEDEAIASLSDAAHETRVRLGMPDDYLALFGGALVEAFAPRFPLVGIDLRCGFSCQLESMVEARELDMAIITQNSAEPKGEVLRTERQVWCAGPSRSPETAPVLRLALFPDGCRSKPLVLRSLDKAGRPWKIGYSSSSIQGLQLAVASGDMITVLPESAVPPDWRRLGEEDGLPPIPSLALAIYTFQQSRLAVRQVTSFMRTCFSDAGGTVVEKALCL
ncbi:LysR family transcriptional regulator [Aureimonas phyllosphaerae]|uniref:LysR family transcriptional regulator n=1 Tax=Aureimonas phyllosphaerae TaxID=1166078 RepID=UPI003A5C45BA